MRIDVRGERLNRSCLNGAQKTIMVLLEVDCCGIWGFLIVVAQFGIGKAKIEGWTAMLIEVEKSESICLRMLILINQSWEKTRDSLK